MKESKKLRKGFAVFYKRIKQEHKKSKQANRGHGLDHDVTVSQIVIRIAPDIRTMEKAWCAAMLHSFDRLYGKRNKQQEKARMRKCLNLLPKKYFTPEESEEIFQAAFRHEELNQKDQSLTQQVLMDADRLSNLMLPIIIRAGQFRPEIPVLEFKYLEGKKNPLSDHYHPQSILDDIRNSIIEQAPQIRTSKAKKLRQIYVKELKNFIRSLEKSCKELGLVGISL